MSPRRRTALIVLAAMLGIAVAAAITYGTSQLVSQRIGLASEPITAGRALLAPAVRHPARTRTKTTPAAPPERTSVPTEPPAASPTEAAPVREAPAASPETPVSPARERPRSESGSGGEGGDGRARGDD